jgi:hypothetical protein
MSLSTVIVAAVPQLLRRYLVYTYLADQCIDRCLAVEHWAGVVSATIWIAERTGIAEGDDQYSAGHIGLDQRQAGLLILLTVGVMLVSTTVVRVVGPWAIAVQRMRKTALQG